MIALLLPLLLIQPVHEPTFSFTVHYVDSTMGCKVASLFDRSIGGYTLPNLAYGKVPLSDHFLYDSSHFTWVDGDSVLHIKISGLYKVTASVTVEAWSSGSQNKATVYITRNGAAIGGTGGIIYCHTNGFGGTAMVQCLRVFAAGDSISLIARRTAGTNTLKTTTDCVSLIAEFLRY